MSIIKISMLVVTERWTKQVLDYFIFNFIFGTVRKVKCLFIYVSY